MMRVWLKSEWCVKLLYVVIYIRLLVRCQCIEGMFINIETCFQQDESLLSRKQLKLFPAFNMNETTNVLAELLLIYLFGAAMMT